MFRAKNYLNWPTFHEGIHKITLAVFLRHGVLSSYSQRSDSLRARGHDCVLPVCFRNLHKQSFIVRCLLILYSKLPVLSFHFFIIIKLICTRRLKAKSH